VIPDTNNIDCLSKMKFQYVSIFHEGAYDFDLRLSLYECASLNFFNNNGPCIASGLNPRVSHILTKLIVPSVPHCTVEFIERQGYQFGSTPGYSNNSKWLWGVEDFDVIVANSEKLLR
jgi:hypothetical protein